MYRGSSIMCVDGKAGTATPGGKAMSFWGYRRGTTAFLALMLGVGLVLFSIGLSNEARIRPYRYYYNCEEYTDIDDFTWTTCECEPPEYEMYLGLAIVGFISMVIGGILLANLMYHSRDPSDPSEGSGW